MARLLLVLFGMLAAHRPGAAGAPRSAVQAPRPRRRPTGGSRDRWQRQKPEPDDAADDDWAADVNPWWPDPPPPSPWSGEPERSALWRSRDTGGAGYRGGPAAAPRRRRVRRWAVGAVAVAAAGLIFRRAIAAVAVGALSAALHLVGVTVHLPDIRFGWPWQRIGAGSTSDTELGPWVLQKVEGIGQPALSTANFSFVFTHKVSKNIGPWPCWYAGTFYAVGHASATVDLNPGSGWWKAGAGHYRLRILSRPAGGAPGRVAVTMVLPRPELPRSVHDVSIDDVPSKPVATQHSWTYPGFGCGVLLRPQFSAAVLYAQAQRLAFTRATRDPQITGPLVNTAKTTAERMVRDDFIQPAVNAFDYTLQSFTLDWAAGP